MSGRLNSNESINDNGGGGAGDDNDQNQQQQQQQQQPSISTNTNTTNTSLFNAHQRGSSSSLASMGGFLRRTIIHRPVSISKKKQQQQEQEIALPTNAAGMKPPSNYNIVPALIPPGSNTDNESSSAQPPPPTSEEKDKGGEVVGIGRGGGSGGGATTSSDDSMAHANAAFLGALRAESVPVGVEDDDIGGMGGLGRARTKPYFPSGSFVIHPTPSVKPLVARQQQQQQVGAGQTTTTKASSSHSTSYPPSQSKNNNEASLDTDSKFLMAIHHGAQYANNNDDTSSVECGETTTYNSGTLVINFPPTARVKGSTTTTTGSSDIETSNASFMTAIQAAADEDDGEDMVTTDATTAVVAVEGETDSERERTDAETDADIDETMAEVDDILDEDITGISIPMHPFMEKVLLPRPLFFGHVLPPRIVAEAERAASAYAISDSLEDVTTTATTSLSQQQQQQQQQPDSLTNVDSESFAADDSSVMSSMSLSSIMPGGGKIFESSVAPCCRNFEGAIDVFGFGVNPFLAAHYNAKEDHSVGRRRDEHEELPTPHPYVSIYSPVWGEWGRTARAKARRRKGRLADEAKAEIESKNAAEEAAKPITPVTPKSSDHRQDLRPLTSPSRRRQHKKTASQDFSNLWSKFQSPSLSSPSSSSSATTTEGMLKENASVFEAPKPLDEQSINFSQDDFLQYARAGTVNYDINRGSGTFVETTKAPTSNKGDNISQDQFLQLIRVEGEEDIASDGTTSGTFVGVGGDADAANNKIKALSGPLPVMNSSTFVQAVKFSSEDASDNDFIEAAEERKTVGLNDNMSAAVAMLAGSGEVDDDDDDADVYRGIGAPVFLAAGGGSMAANKYGRPYSNLELTNGCTPLYGCDDPALPHESDLGVFETKEDEKRSAERRREQHMIGQFASPGIMPHVACPTQCLDVDDSTSWNARFAESDSGYNRSGGNTMVISLDGHLPPGPDTLISPQPKPPLYEVSRIAWWNLPDGFDEIGKTCSKTSRTFTCDKDSAPTPELVPALDDPIPLDVQTNLWPPLRILRENNISCNRSHSATFTARFLPHLSDRPPSVRHLQIDTTAVGFPSLGGEIEPMFCKLAIFHFEMSAERIPGSSTHLDSDSVSTTASVHPSPNLERCGQVTEFLNFDIVQDPTVIKNCRFALWPYAEESDGHGLGRTSPEVFAVDMDNRTAQSEGTSCGIFPLGSDLSISNLYAVIIVHKVIAEHASELHPYYKPGRRESAQEGIDLETLRARAAKSCIKFGQVIMPFAFGVVPLKHIIGDESPKAPVSRAVQIPLFKYDVERGAQTIYDHILLMLHPKMEPRGGKAASMTRGHVLLVMRYFGYLGLHSILKKRSSLAREHLVDATGELQVKCTDEKDSGSRGAHKPKCPALGETFVLPPWRSQFQIEPARFGGRNVRDPSVELGDASENGTPKFIYAQEIAPLPLERSISESSSRGGSKSTRSKYDGKLLHTSLCNELVCQPKCLLNCIRNRIFVKVEVRELVWSKSLNADIAIPVQPCIHNARRGPWLVQEVFSACAMGTPQFLDEFKMKLPLILGAPGRERFGLLFSIYQLEAHVNELESSLHDLKGGTSDSEYFIEQIGCGFLPLTLETDPSCLVANGFHNVPIAFRAVLLASGVDAEHMHPSECVAKITGETDELTPPLNADESYPKGSLVLTPLQPPNDDDSQVVDAVDEGSHSSNTDLPSKISRSRSESSLKDTFEDVLILQVAIIAITSVHPQNRALADFFLTKPMPPRCLMPSDFSEPYVPWGKVRSEIIYRLKPERIPPFNFVGGALAETERKMLEPVVSLTKSSKCPHSDLMTHLVRIVSQLWRTAVSGAGEPSILWASPESLIPLRLNAFATLLHTVSSASHHMAKAGLRQLDGNASWDITALGKLLSMLFDEWAILGGPLEKPLIVKTNSQNNAPISKPKIISNRAKTTTGISAGSSRPIIIGRYSSEESSKLDQAKKFDVEAMLKTNVSLAENPSTVVDLTRSLTSKDSGFKVDSKSDFMLALTRSLESEPDSAPKRTAGRAADNFLKSVAHGPAANRRRWNTLPSNSLATIQENDADLSRSGGPDQLGQQSGDSLMTQGESIESELVLRRGEKKTTSRQFRVPQLKLNDSIEPPSSEIDPTDKSRATEVKNSTIKPRTLPINDGDIETAGTAFLDAISKSMGFGKGHIGKELVGEERRVGAAHHRKTRSRCSIDWSLPPTDMLLEKDQRIEELNRTMTGNVTSTLLPLSTIESAEVAAGVGISADISSREANDWNLLSVGTSVGREHPLKQRRRTLSKDESIPAEILVLPDFADRMSAMKNSDDEHDEKRWWPYVYEVIIYQWVALLDEQTKKGDGAKKSEECMNGENSTSGLSPIVIKYLSHAAKASRGATIRCAPFLFEIIKQSLSWRIDCVFRQRNVKEPTPEQTNYEDAVPPLVKLDENIMAALEKLITMLVDASIDSRNFDSFEYRKISIDVNDAVVRFIRDLFALLDVRLVHRLAMLYFSRFVVKEGKHWHDRDSKLTGLRCSWETTKLRLNAITLFIRFPEFTSVCTPLMESWALPVGSSPEFARRFFSDALEMISSLGLSEFTATEGPVSKEPIAIPIIKPHWLAELCTDICLAATGHAEESIQFRASSLLFELFWRLSQQGRVKGNLSIVASVFTPFVPKILSHIEYLSSLPAKGQLRKDIIPCFLFVLQSAPTGIMKALWRKLAKRAEGNTLRKDSADKYGGIVGAGSGDSNFSTIVPVSQVNEYYEIDGEPDIYDMFGLLNLSLVTIEYEGSGNQSADNIGGDAENNEKSMWRREYLLSRSSKTAVNPRFRHFNHGQTSNSVGEIDVVEQPTTNESRRWHAHDCSMVIINICRQIVREILGMLRPNMTVAADMKETEFQLLSSGIRFEEEKSASVQHRSESLTFAVTDTIIFVRAAGSVYLHALSMKQSDIVITKTLTAAVEIVKIFGVKVFLSAVGETLQHWMRVILEHCGARRAELRVEACEFLNLLLRLTYDSFGSFTRVRLPLLAVISEVMERIVAKSSRKYLFEQRLLGLSPIPLSNDSAEASLTPLWRTIDRLHNQSATQNLAFKSALARLAIKMKKIFRAYLAAHALAIVNRSESVSHSESGFHGGDAVPSQMNAYVQSLRVSVHRIVSNSSWFSKRFLGNQTAVPLDRSMIQTEAVEDSFLIAADVFSSTELPSHRVAWLQKLAEFHRMRGRFAEEATCRCKMYHTYREAAKRHDHIWSSSPFLPWASSLPDTSNPDSEGHAIVSDFDYEIENLSGGSGKLIDRGGSAFRRIFYRAADSVRVRTGDWGNLGGGKYLFYGVTLKSEFDSVSPWYSLREMEENMVEEAEISGDLYLRSGIVESSRYALSLANQFYAETFNYARLAYVYRKLAHVVTSQVPIIDASNQLELSSQLGRFYKVYFHGGAPDDLLHSQGPGGFVYRVPSNIQIKDFASVIEEAIRCILPAKTVIDLQLDDGSPTVGPLTNVGKRQSVIGGAPVEPVTIKVTPLRPLFKVEADEKCFRGTPEWFQLKAEDRDLETEGSRQNSTSTMLSSLPQRSLSACGSNSFSSVGSLTTSSRRPTFRSKRQKSLSLHEYANESDKDGLKGEPIGVDRFYFTQPMRKDPVRGFRDWLKVPSNQIAERSLRVTELQVENPFPACVTRQQIIHRAVFTQSPLEASVEAVSTWCSVLFRTVIATNGQGVLGGERHQGLNAESAKLVMECIHSSGVKQIGTSFLSVDLASGETGTLVDEPSVGAPMFSQYESLDEAEIERVQAKLARMILTFLELLHLLIARNRDVLLTVVQARKRRGGGDTPSVASCLDHDGYTSRQRTNSQSFSPVREHSELGTIDNEHGYLHERHSSEIVGRSIITENQESHMNHCYSSNISDRTDSAIGVQSELQRGLINLVKTLSPFLSDTLQNEVPRWLLRCCQENYFSTGMYRGADIPMREELFFHIDASDASGDDERASKSEASMAIPRSIRGSGQTYRETSPTGSLCSGASDRRDRTTFDRTTMLRPPTDGRSIHRSDTSGAS